MSLYVGLNRRSGSDRREWDTSPGTDQRGMDRRRHGTDSYVVVMGDGGVDRFGLLGMAIGLPAACLIAFGLIGAFAAT